MIVKLRTQPRPFDFHRIEGVTHKDYLTAALKPIQTVDLEEERRRLRQMVIPLPFMFLAGFFAGIGTMLFLHR
jgi:hypothetical protein